MAILNSIKSILAENQLIVGVRLLGELFDEWIQLRAQLGACKCSKTKAKMEAKLTVGYHAIEKGLSLNNSKIGFGEARILSLIQKMRLYYYRFGDTSFLQNPFAVIQNYLDCQLARGYDSSIVRKEFLALLREMPVSLAAERVGGIKVVRKADILLDCDFEKFVLSRHSIRDFSDELVTREQILKAITLAQKSPSACNRQAWYAYVFYGELKDSLLQFQGGANGFSQSVNAGILVVSDLRSYFINEIHHCYIDGSLFAMSLIYAFHAQGIGTIPLTTSFKRAKLRQFRKNFDVPDYHVPIMIVGVGHLKEEFNVACSSRNSPEEIINFRGYSN